MDVWYTKPTASGTYTRQKSPSSYGGDCEDLDANSYRSKETGNLIDNVISTRWSKLKFSFNCLTKIRVSKFSWDILETGDYKLSFNLVQKKKVSGQ